MGTKHGVWFDLAKHLAIHNSVINQFSWLIQSGQTSYSIQRFQNKGNTIINHSISFETTNGYQVGIIKDTLVSLHDPTSAMTVNFSYNCRKQSTNFHLRYHSAHSSTYNPKAPWHDKPHRHEFDGKQKNIEIYSHDHRPKKDQLNKYTWKGFPVTLTFLENEDWPFVSEFLEEVSFLK